MKRLMDIVVAGTALVVLALPMLVIAASIRVALGKPILFVQERPGLHEVPFKLIKFRTMRDAWDGEGRPLPDEIRLTRFGRFLRSTSLDELPELWNVVRGDMSLVGPRPLLMAYLPHYSAEQRRRHTVRPGVTGWAQVNGRNALSWDEKFRLDVWYVNHHSLRLDLEILWRTLVTVLRREGIAAKGHVTMSPFCGKL